MILVKILLIGVVLVNFHKKIANKVKEEKVPLNMKSTSVAILIPVFNNIEFTKKCLNQLSKVLSEISSNEEHYKIVVIDDGSTDGTTDWVKKSHHNVIILNGDGNLWWSGSINKGVEYVIRNQVANFVLWWNNDIEPEKNYFVELKSILTGLDTETVIGSKIFDLKSGKVWGMGGTFNRMTGYYKQIANMVNDSQQYDTVIDVDWLPGMGTVMPISVFDKVGFLDDTNFPQYHGDLDFTLRCKLNGYSVKVFPSLRIYNDTSNSGFKKKDSWKDLISSLKNVKSLNNIEKKIALYKKHTYTPLPYFRLFYIYFKFFGGFFKWKLLNSVGLKRTDR